MYLLEQIYNSYNEFKKKVIIMSMKKKYVAPIDFRKKYFKNIDFNKYF
jgi:hypothetical protein